MPIKTVFSDDFTIAITDYPPFTLKAKLDIHALNTLAFKETNSANLVGRKGCPRSGRWDGVGAQGVQLAIDF